MENLVESDIRFLLLLLEWYVQGCANKMHTLEDTQKKVYIFNKQVKAKELISKLYNILEEK